MNCWYIWIKLARPLSQTSIVCESFSACEAGFELFAATVTHRALRPQTPLGIAYAFGGGLWKSPKL